jgi:hypothetical protein
MRIRVGDLVKKRLNDHSDFKVFAICLVTRNQVLFNNNVVGIEVEHLFLEGEPQEIDGLLSHLEFASEEKFIEYYNKKPWACRCSRSQIMKVLS